MSPRWRTCAAQSRSNPSTSRAWLVPRGRVTRAGASIRTSSCKARRRRSQSAGSERRRAVAFEDRSISTVVIGCGPRRIVPLMVLPWCAATFELGPRGLRVKDFESAQPLAGTLGPFMADGDVGRWVGRQRDEPGHSRVNSPELPSSEHCRSSTSFTRTPQSTPVIRLRNGLSSDASAKSGRRGRSQFRGPRGAARLADDYAHKWARMLTGALKLRTVEPWRRASIAECCTAR